MSPFTKLFGNSDPSGQAQYDAYMAGLRNQNHAAQNAAYNQQIGVQQAMAGGGLATGIVNTQLASNQLASNGAYAKWGQHLTPTQVRDKTRIHIANEVEKMAEEIGAPTLLHAVVLAIRTMEIPE